jgi:hypothetical protein
MLRGFESHPLRLRLRRCTAGNDLTFCWNVSILSRHLPVACFALESGWRLWVVGEQATLAQSVEQAPCKRWVVGSNPTGGSRYGSAHVAQSVEHTLGKGEVKGSSPFVGSRNE